MGCLQDSNTWKGWCHLFGRDSLLKIHRILDGDWQREERRDNTFSPSNSLEGDSYWSNWSRSSSGCSQRHCSRLEEGCMGSIDSAGGWGTCNSSWYIPREKETIEIFELCFSYEPHHWYWAFLSWRSSKSASWQDAMTKEYQSIMKNDVWDIVPRTEGKSIVTSKCIYKIKHSLREHREAHNHIFC